MTCRKDFKRKKTTLWNRYIIRLTELCQPIVIYMFQLSISNTNPPSEVNSIVQNIGGVIEKIDKTTTSYDTLSEKAEMHLENTSKVQKTISDYMEKIDVLEQTLQYMQIIVNIDNLK